MSGTTTATSAAGAGMDGVLAQAARDLAQVFRAAGREMFAVGGSVRDQILGRPVHDLDLTTDAEPPEIKRLAKRVHPAGIYDVGAKFGTIGLIFTSPALEEDQGRKTKDGTDTAAIGPSSSVLGPAGTQRVIEITTYRTEQYVDGTRKPDVTFGTSLQDDLARRDFTMNAIAVDVLTGETHDPYGGRTDIAAKLVRAVGDPAERFREDPLRLLRAVRFAAQLGFRIEPATQRAIEENAAALERISRERVADELTKILVSPRASHGLRLATDLGLMEYAIPEVLPMRGVSQRPLHHKDVFEHTMGVVDNIPPEKLLRWTALLHDIGKPATKSVHEGEVHFFGHEDVGERMARRILTRLHFDHRSIDRVGKLVRMHLRVNSYESDWTDSAVRRLIREVGDDLPDLIHLSRADVTSYRSERVRAATRRADEFERRAQELMAREDVAKIQSPLDGDDLMRLFGKGPGPWIKPIKEYLLNLVLEGELAQDDVETATALAVRFAAEEGLASATMSPES
jgi:poly(A) polymerase